MKKSAIISILFVFVISFYIADKIFASEILFAGDVTLTRNIPPTQSVFLNDRAKKRIRMADVFVWNAEFSGQSDDPEKKRFVFSCDSDIVRHMKTSNGLATIANNHSFDGKNQGFGNLVKSLTDNEMAYIGLRDFDPERNFIAATTGGRRLFFLNYSPMLARKPMPFSTPSFEDIKATLRFLNRVKNKNDKIIVCVHDGIEGSNEISRRQKDQVFELSRLGADIIAYSHSHTYIDPQIIDGTLVLWGLGNFIFGGHSKCANSNDIRMLSVNPDTLEWEWIKGKTRNYIFDTD